MWRPEAPILIWCTSQWLSSWWICSRSLSWILSSFNGIRDNQILYLHHKKFFLIFYCFYYENLSLAPFGFYDNINYHYISRSNSEKLSPPYFQRIFIVFYYYRLCVLCKAIIFGSGKQTKNVLIASWMASDKFSWKIIKRCKLLFVCLYCHKCNCSLFFRVSTNELLTASRNTQQK